MGKGAEKESFELFGVCIGENGHALALEYCISVVLNEDLPARDSSLEGLLRLMRKGWDLYTMKKRKIRAEGSIGLMLRTW